MTQDIDGAIDQNEFGGDWTLIKLEVLEKYLKAYTTALKNQHFQLVYIDAFAGTGRCDVRVMGDTRSTDGSARRALQVTPPFDSYVFIEKATKKADALAALKAAHPEKSIEIVQDDSNKALQRLCKSSNWVKQRAVLFLDPFGLQVDWVTLQSIAKTRAIDVWYLFPYAGLYRQAPKDIQALDPGKEAAITRALGTDEWKDNFYAESPQTDLFSSEGRLERVADHIEMLQFVSDRLRGIFAYVSKPKILYQSHQPGRFGAPLFALYFAVSNPAKAAIGTAARIAEHILNMGA